MKKNFVTLFILIAVFFLVSCSNPEESAVNFVEEFTTQFESNEVVFTEEQYTKDNLEKSFTDEYFSNEFLGNVLPVKLSELSFNLEEDVLTLPEEVKFLRISRNNTVDWVSFEIENIEINDEEDQANINLKSRGTHLTLELIKENNNWKIKDFE